MRLNGIDYHIAETRADLEGAVRLVYHNYIEKDYCRLNPHEMYFYLHDVLPDTRTLVASRDGTVISTLTLVFDSPLGLPSDALYRQENDGMRRRGRRLAEISKLSSDRRLERDTLRVLGQLFRLAYLTAFRLRGVDELVILVEPHHESFYQAAMGFVRLGGLKPDPSASNAPSLLQHLDLAGVTDEGRRQHEARPGSSRRYTHYVLDPLVPALEAELRRADDHLSRMHRRIEELGPHERIDPAEEAYLDLRLFAIGFNCDKISGEALRCDREGRFRDELALYERLLTVMPARYAPERRSRILRDAVVTAWHCGHFPRALGLCAMLERESVTTQQRADALMLRGTVMHFQGSSHEAAMAFAEALTLPELDAVTRTNLMHTSARLAIDHGRLDEARLHLAAGTVSLDEVETEDAQRQLRGLLAHDRYVLEQRNGDLAAADAALAGFQPHLEQVRPSHRMMHISGRAALALQRLRPRNALENARAALAGCDPDSSPFNAAIIITTQSLAHLALGDYTAARTDAERALRWTLGIQHPGASTSAAKALVDALLVADRDREANRVPGRIAHLLAKPQPPRIAVEALTIQAGLACARRDWAAATQFLDQALLKTRLERAPSAFVLLMRIEVALCAGRQTDVAALTRGLPDPEMMPGFDTYRCRWLAVRSALHAIAGRSDAEADLDEISARHREAGACHGLADIAAWLLEAARTCACPVLHRRALAELRAAVRMAPMPRFLRIAEEAG